LMPFVSVLVDFLTACCWWWTVKRYMKMCERKYGIDAKMRDVGVKQIKCGAVVVDGKVNNEILTRNRDSLVRSGWKGFGNLEVLVDLYFGDKVQGGLAHIMVNFGTHVISWCNVIIDGVI
ncbi:14595_t:CDS:1, partial [Racocetra persica]